MKKATAKTGLTAQHERRLWKTGHCFVAGVDEVGRGAWAGPIVAAAVIFPAGTVLGGIKDSKQLTPRQRERAFVQIIRTAVGWGIGLADNHAIDRLGIVAANKLVFQEALNNLPQRPDYIFLDALTIRYGSVPCDARVRADAEIFSVAAASIVAKVYRDYLMTRYHAEYPEYDFPKHKGYGTSEHAQAIGRHGLAAIHRRTFCGHINVRRRADSVV